MMTKHIGGMIVDIHTRRTYPGIVTVEGQRIVAIEEVSEAPSEQFIMPGFVDAHVHIESSMLIPSEFARLAVVHGTVATVSDPHEIGNVCGIDGVWYMIENASRVPFTVAFEHRHAFRQRHSKPQVPRYPPKISVVFLMILVCDT